MTDAQMEALCDHRSGPICPIFILAAAGMVPREAYDRHYQVHLRRMVLKMKEALKLTLASRLDS